MQRTLGAGVAEHPSVHAMYLSSTRVHSEALGVYSLGVSGHNFLKPPQASQLAYDMRKTQDNVTN